MLLGKVIDSLDDRIDRYELVYMRFSWIFCIIGLIYSICCNIVYGDSTGCFWPVAMEVTMFVVILLINLVKLTALKRGVFFKDKLFISFRIVEISLLAVATTRLRIDFWAYIVLILLVMITGLGKGSKSGCFIAVYASVIHFILRALPQIYFSYEILIKLILDIPYYLIGIIIAIICGMIHDESARRESENIHLVKELEEKYDQLSVAQEEITFHYDKLRDVNLELEDTNKKLSESIAEFYTLQQISQAISSIFDIKELLRYVNDIILGVMGVNNSTIALFDEKSGKLRVYTTSIQNQNILFTLNDNINCKILLDILKTDKPIMENYAEPDKYVFIKGREVSSLMCVPLSTKSKKFGLVLVEHRHFNRFDDNNLRLMSVIGQQVSIAMENAELYQRMQELATIDGLTGVYNRLYFNERLQKEVEKAREKGYELTLAIFDVDLFKRFNDSFGHLFGDKVIRSVAELVKSSIRSSDVLARFGGEEFVILFPRTGLKEAAEKVEFLRKRISLTRIEESGIKANVTASFGVSCYPETAATENELLQSADSALYEAKAMGRNRVCVVSAGIK